MFRTVSLSIISSVHTASGVYTQHCTHSNRYMSYRLCCLLASRIRMEHPNPASKQTFTPITTPGNCKSSCNNISCSLISAHSKAQLMFFSFSVLSRWYGTFILNKSQGVFNKKIKPSIKNVRYIMSETITATVRYIYSLSLYQTTHPCYIIHII